MYGLQERVVISFKHVLCEVYLKTREDARRDARGDEMLGARLIINGLN